MAERLGTVGMIKSELVTRIATQNPHLYQRDVENIVNAILGEIVAAMARGDRVELRAEVDALRRGGAAGEPPARSLQVDYAPRLTIPPPAG